jgi:hypothetical protein
MFRRRQECLFGERVLENFRTVSVGRPIGTPRVAHHSTGIVAVSSTATIAVFPTKPVRPNGPLPGQLANAHVRSRRVRTGMLGRAAFSGLDGRDAASVLWR